MVEFNDARQCLVALLAEMPFEFSTIRLEYATGEYTQQQLADHYGTSRSNIGLIVNHKNWKGVK